MPMQITHSDSKAWEKFLYQGGRLYLIQNISKGFKMCPEFYQ